MAGWELRAGRDDDVEAIAELRAVVLRDDLERLGRYDPDRVRQRLRDAYVPAYTSIIEVDGRFAGSVALRPGEDGRWLEHFYLAPQLQGRGIGAQVLTRVLAGRETTRLIVLRGSRAQRLYERYGFVVEQDAPIDVVMLRESST